MSTKHPGTGGEERGDESIGRERAKVKDLQAVENEKRDRREAERTQED